MLHCMCDDQVETISTLRFGTRAKMIQNKAKINEERSVDELKAAIVKTQRLVDEYRSQIRFQQQLKFPTNFADTLAGQLCAIQNCSLRVAYVPDRWRSSNQTSLPKPRKDITKHGPASHLSHPSYFQNRGLHM